MDIASPPQPLTASERLASVDVLRGLALFGVLTVNLWSDFRVPLPRHLLTFHTGADALDRMADLAVAALLEFKAFTLFALLFGVGAAVFAERAKSHVLILRRLLALLALGLLHLLLVWNGDILTLYAICGLCLMPTMRLRPTVQAGLGVAAIAVGFAGLLGFLWPGDATLRRLADEAEGVTRHGDLAELTAYHLRETRSLILPLLGMSLPRTWGLMALGAAAWRVGIFREPERHRFPLRAAVVLGLLVGVPATLGSVVEASSGRSVGVSRQLLEIGSFLPLSLAFASGAVLLLESPVVARALSPFAAVGRMALTHYLTQSVVLTLLFTGVGLGWTGIGSAAGVAVAAILYALQAAASVLWLRRCSQGPVEWLWRAVTYGHPPTMRRPPRP